MKIASWNVNSLNVRLPQVLTWLESAQPDVLALQETKLSDGKFPAGEIDAAGYHVVFSGQKTYNGVALLSKQPIEEVITDIPNLEDPQRRILGATIGGVRILNLYVVNGQEVGSEKYDYKLEWLEKVHDYVAGDLKRHERYVILGDFNIAPGDADVYDPQAWEERILCSTPEREALQQIMALGFSDSFRLFEQ
ncbi:MAG: exodeoxyribonuclease III, partial [Pseudomonadota bacterium]